MEIKELRNKLNLTQRQFGERIGLQPQTILKYESRERNIPDSIQKLIRYEFAEHLPEGEGLFSKNENAVATGKTEADKGLREENERLLQRVKELERDKQILQGVVESLTSKPKNNQVS